MELVEEMIKELVNYTRKNKNTEIWICSSMGQKCVDGYESIKKQLQLKEPKQLLKT